MTVLLSVFGILVFFLALWALVTQPMMSTDGSRSHVDVNPGELETHVRMLSETFVPRDYTHPENLDKVAAYVRRQFAETSGIVSEQSYDHGGNTYRNVILRLGPESEERIVVGAHYDAYGAFPGADDNASAVAGLIALALLLDGAELPMMVELVAYTLEEPPYFRTDLMGSAVHARHLKNAGIRVRAMICLEMIGLFLDEKGSQHYPLPGLGLFYPSQGDFVAVVGHMGSMSLLRRVKRAMRGASDLPVYSFNAPASLVYGVDLSDHMNYWKQGYPAVMVTDTAFMRNTHYHSEFDTAEKLDYHRTAMVVIGVYEAVLALAEP